MALNTILLAEDNPDDAFIFQMMFERASLPPKLFRVDNGLQVIEWLSGHEKYSDREKFPLPDLLLLDLKMPIKSGFEVMEWMASQARFDGLRIAVLSSSDESRDLKRAAQLGAVHFFVKSPRLEDVMQFLRAESV